MNTVVEVKDSIKKYGDLVVVNELSFEIEREEIFGLVGPNGAGKTTTGEMLEGLREPAILFWAIASPTLWMDLFGAIFNEPMDYQGVSLNQANSLLPGGIGIVICASAFIGMSTTLATYRERCIPEITSYSS